MGIIFYNRVNDSPYKYSYQEIVSTNPCVTGDTFVQTVEGQIKIKNLVGKEIDVYCMSDEGKLEVGKAFNIRKTKKDAEIIRIYTTRGYLDCTPDHLIFTRNRGYIEAKYLTKNDKLVGLNRKMQGEHYCSVSLTGNKEYEKEHRFIMRHYEDISDKDVHHMDEYYLNNVKSNLEVLDHSYHSKLSNKGHTDWNEHDDNGYFIKKETLKKKEQKQLENGNKKGLNLGILGIEHLETKEDVYDLEVETFHNFIANGIVIHNCGEQGLPPNGCCNLGSLDLSKFFRNGKFDYELFEKAIRLSVKFLDQVIDVNQYPTDEIKQWAENNRPVGLGIMGLADLFLLEKIAYGSQESLNYVDNLMSFMKKIAEEESVKLSEIFGVPDTCKYLPIPRRNITCLTVAPTGSIALLAGCHGSGCEPIFSEFTTRKDNTGTYQIYHPDYEQPYFRCAVASNGSQEVTWKEHILVQAKLQEYVDSGISKTINYPNRTRKETMAESFIFAWKMKVKGITAYRNGSRSIEVLSPKNLKKDKCPVCGEELVNESGCKKCSNAECGFTVCEIS